MRTSLPASAVVPSIRRTVGEVDPELVITRIATLDGLVDESIAETRLMMLLLLVGAAAALLLGVIGIYGLLAYTVRLRTAELGVRLALGASPPRVARMVLRQGAVMASAGIAAGLLAAFALTRLLDTLLYEVSPGDPAAVGAAAALLFAVAVMAAYPTGTAAARIDPVRALKAE